MEKDLLFVLKSLVHRVDFDVEPYVPAGCSIKEHRKSGVINIETITLFYSKKVKSLREVLRDANEEFLANASFLDYFICNKGLISKDWKGLKILFGGTIYENIKGELFVRGLFWDNESWEWNFVSLDESFSKNYVLVLLG